MEKIIEFNCGMCKAVWPSANMEWMIKVNNVPFGYISEDGNSICYITQHYINRDQLTEISILMDNIKRQYKQLQTT